MADSLVRAYAARTSCEARGRGPGRRIGLPLMIGVVIALVATNRTRREPRFRELGLVLGG